jgi:hypothetical protein
MARSSEHIAVRPVVVALLAACAAWAPARASAAPPATPAGGAPTQAQIDEATTLYDAGLDLRAAGDLRGALGKLQAAFDRVPTPVIGLELAVTHEQLHELRAARETLGKVAALPVAAAEGAASTRARARAPALAAELDARIPTIRVTVRGATGSEVVVRVDGAALQQGAAMPVDPGRHTVVATQAGGPEVRREIEAAEGARAEVSLLFPSAAAASMSGPTAAPAPPSRTVLWVGLGVTGAGLLLGAPTGIAALAKASEVKSRCPTVHCPDEKSAIATSELMGNLSTAGFVVAGVGAGIGVAGLARSLRRPEPRAGRVAPFIGPGAAGVAGRF